MKLPKYIALPLLMLVVSFFFFPIGFSFLPSSLNTKQILGIAGIIAFVIKSYKERTLSLSKPVIVASYIAVVFSIWCLFSAVANGTSDYTYASYFVSFAVWLGGAYGMCALLKHYHGKIDLALLTKYLAAVGVFQCIVALMNDNVPAFKDFIDSYVEQTQRFLDEVGRMYGLGASLDTGGIRFAAILILIAHQIATNYKVSRSVKALALYFGAFFIITVVGNMIARTTTAGTAMGLLYLVIILTVSQGGKTTIRKLKITGVLLLLIAVGTAIVIAFYNSDPKFHSHIRFAFEGFFNFFETGVFRTDSTDKLNNLMWVWPDNFQDWMIGTGIFGHFAYSTDIGYCRFILYCGLVGFSIFSVFFIYNSLAMIGKFRSFAFLALMLIALSFIIWAKVATDLFFLNAILFCLDPDGEEEPEEPEPVKDVGNKYIPQWMKEAK